AYERGEAQLVRPGSVRARSAGVVCFSRVRRLSSEGRARKERVMNSTVIAGGRGVNRLDAFLDNQQAAGNPRRPSLKVKTSVKAGGIVHYGSDAGNLN